MAAATAKVATAATEMAATEMPTAEMPATVASAMTSAVPAMASNQDYPATCLLRGAAIGRRSRLCRKCQPGRCDSGDDQLLQFHLYRPCEVNEPIFWPRYYDGT